MIRIASLAALLLVACLAHGAAGTENLSWYDVEVLVFKNNPTQAEMTEIWPADPGQPDLARAVELAPPTSDPLIEAPRPFQQLGVEALTLAAVARRLASSPGYEPLVHIAWRQPVGPQTDTPAVRVYREDSAGALPEDATVAEAVRTIDGSVRINRNRFLHVDVDLVYSRMRTPAPALFGIGGGEDRGPELFRLQQSRRINSNELHYFDHPAFGLLVKLAPYEAPGQEGGGSLPR